MLHNKEILQIDKADVSLTETKKSKNRRTMIWK